MSNKSISAVVIPPMQMTTLMLPHGAPQTALTVCETGQLVLAPEGLPQMLRPDHLRMMVNPEGARSTLQWCARFLGFEPEDFERFDWAVLCRYPVLMEFRQRFLELAESGRISRKIANGHVIQLRLIALEAWKVDRIDRETYERIKAIEGIKFPHGKKPMPEITPDDYNEAMKVCDMDGRLRGSRYIGSRQRGILTAAIIALLHWTGCRSVGVRRLQLKHVNWATAQAYLVEKGQEARTVSLAPDCMARLHAWHEIRGDEPGPFFYKAWLKSEKDWARGPNGKPMGLTYSTMASMMKRIARRTGVAAFKTHAFRRGFISHFIDKGLSAPDLQAMSGHVNANQLITYDQRGLKRWEERWQDEAVTYEFSGATGAPAKVEPTCPICGCSLYAPTDEAGNVQKPMAPRANVCRKKACRRAYAPDRRPVTVVIESVASGSAGESIV